MPVLVMLIDICIPQNNEAVLARKAKELGYEAIFLYNFKNRNELLRKKSEVGSLKFGVKVYVGTFVAARNTSDVRKLQGLYSDSDLIAVSAKDESTVRFAASCSFVDLLFEITTSSGRDRLDYRISNLNAIIANIMKDRKQAYALSFAHFLAGKGTEKDASHPLAKIIGREMQNIQLTRRKAPILFASFAREPAHMRLAENLAAFGRVLGLNYPQSKAATSSAIENILKRKEQIRAKNYVRAGVRIVD